MINPYETINWNNCFQTMTTSHDHVLETNPNSALYFTTQRNFDRLYQDGIRCFAISNYYPSAPMYPLNNYISENNQHYLQGFFNLFNEYEILNDSSAIFDGYIRTSNDNPTIVQNTSYNIKLIIIKAAPSTTYKIKKFIETHVMKIGTGNIKQIYHNMRVENVQEYHLSSSEVVSNDPIIITTRENDNYLYVQLWGNSDDNKTLSDYTKNLSIIPINSNDTIVEIPNAEHHNLRFNGLLGNSIHMNAIGSLFTAGSPYSSQGKKPGGQSNGYQTTFSIVDNNSSRNNIGNIQSFIKDAVSNLLYTNKGGVTINHPIWTKTGGSLDEANPGSSICTSDMFKKILDYSDKVLGIEIIATWTHELTLWDEILLSGRKCWAFAGPDHRAKNTSNWDTHDGSWWGRIMILTNEEPTTENCLQAIVKGQTYIKKINSPLKFKNITLNQNILSVEIIPDLERNAVINFIADGIIIKTDQDDGSHIFQCNISNVNSYIRIQVFTYDKDYNVNDDQFTKHYDELYSQPIMFYIQDRKFHNKKMINF